MLLSKNWHFNSHESNWPSVSFCQLQHLQNDLEVLLQHYGAAKVVDRIEFKSPVDACKQEFPMFKQLVFHLCSSMSIHELWKVIASKHAKCFQAILTLSSACLVVPVSTAQCEHGFSTQNHIKSNTWNCLKTKYLDILLLISEEGLPIEDFCLSRTVSKFMKMKDCRISHYK